MTGCSKRLKVWKGQVSPEVFPHGPVLSSWFQRSQHQGELLRRRMVINFCAVSALQPKVVKVDIKAKGNLTLHPLPNINQLYAQLC